MLDRKKLVSDSETYLKGLARRGDYAAEVAKPLFDIESRWKELKSEVDGLRHRQKQMGPQMGRLAKDGEEFAKLRKEMGEVSGRVKAAEEQIRSLEEQRRDVLLRIPNLPHESVPDGLSEEDNKEVDRWGEPRHPVFKMQAHWELGESLGIIDFESAARMSGSRFAVLKGAGARLERALIQFMLDLHTQEHGYVEVWPPYLVRRHAMEGTGQLPNLEEDAYRTAGDDPYFLIPTAEVPLVNLHREEILDKDQLPIKYVAYTPCFRAEAGSHGKDVRGLMRQHQFSKVELVKIVEPEGSYDELESLRRNAEEVLRRLEIPYRVMLLSAGDMGFSATKTYDLEAWVPAQDRYREISSCSNCGDFQARRAQIRYRQAKGDNRFCHTLNGSGLAVGRTMIGLLENFQQADGSVILPDAIRPYMGGLSKLG
ncbi:MAG: serine--tRNA ligase [Deltaproteobacteria bacterium]|nr:serine--tRNA ligase [Deltaproteobacteria bacterium]